MANWREKDLRESSQLEISTLVCANAFEKNRYYIRSIAEIVLFLAVNELALRGNYDIDENTEHGLFRNLFEYTLTKNPKLAEIYTQIPKNAHYLSPDIQNDVIDNMSEVVREEIIFEILDADVPWFTLLEDGTRDRNNIEHVSIGIRYVRKGKVFESLVNVATTLSSDAKTMANLTLEILRNNGLDSKRLLSQCYDGASVMSGRKRGVQTLIQEELHRKVPYVHCFNHRLHLVIMKLISEVPELKIFFDQCRMLHLFLNHVKVISIYTGTRIDRLLEQRWSGHLKITEAIYSNYQTIIELLRTVQCSTEFSGEQVVQSTGLLATLIKLEFHFCLIFMKKLLLTIEPADKILQSRDAGLKNAMEIINSVFKNINKLQNPDAFSGRVSEAKSILLHDEVIYLVQLGAKNLAVYITIGFLPNLQQKNMIG
ncbi:Zinc finger MYM-type protein 1-like [Oopsacas minuta]|uniref:Zinc finger MYM-type protein 1-like n=1 Tax=Oopsacas minuta TaxID=111878 RepID=A0AAV7JQV5_9METZ|nr:Zinc finger MYM-type protein 1-like [Oopsacas minuta]